MEFVFEHLVLISVLVIKFCRHWEKLVHRNSRLLLLISCWEAALMSNKDGKYIRNGEGFVFFYEKTSFPRGKQCCSGMWLDFKCCQSRETKESPCRREVQTHVSKMSLIGYLLQVWSLLLFLAAFLSLSDVIQSPRLIFRCAWVLRAVGRLRIVKQVYLERCSALVLTPGLSPRPLNWYKRISLAARWETWSFALDSVGNSSKESVKACSTLQI